MKTISVLALMAALCVATPVIAQNATVTTNNNGGVSGNVGGNNTNANANANVGGAASTNGGNTSASVGASADTSASAGTDLNGSSSASNDGTSSSSAFSSSSSEAGTDCSGIDKSGSGTGPLDSRALSGLTSVNVVALSDCSGLTLDQGSGAALQGNADVATAIKKAGYAGQDIIGYTMHDASLTVYVKKS